MARNRDGMDIDMPDDPGPSKSRRDVHSDHNDSDVSYYDWLADSCTTCHITNQRNTLKNYREEETEIEGIGNTVAISLGRGTTSLTSRVNGERHTILLDNVCYVPKATNNLLSISLFDESGGTATVKGGMMHLLTNEGIEIARAKRQDGLYVLQIENEKEQCNVSKHQPITWMEWHERWGHISFTTLKRIRDSGMVDGFQVDGDPEELTCEACIAAKQTRRPFPQKSEPSTERPGELTHTDVWGPARSPTPTGMKYFVTFIDDYTRRGCVKFLRQKNEASDKLMEHLTWIERQTSYVPKRVRMDNGTEYLNNTLTKWCQEKGIILEITAPYSPQQNGVAERYNRTLTELMHAMLAAKKLPKILWAAAIEHAAYVRNRAYTRAKGEMTPEEAWTEKRQNVSHLQPFGCAVWVINEDKERDKLSTRARAQIFTGWTLNPGTIQYWDIETKRMKTTRNYEFPRGSLMPPQLEGETQEKDGDMTNASSSGSLKIKIPGKRQRENMQRTRTEDTANTAKSNETPPNMDNDPKTIEEAQEREDWPEWQKAIQVELDQLERMKTWKLTKLPPGRTAIGNKWVLVRKYNKNGTLEKYKARLVAKGYSQIPGMDFTETFSPVVRLETIRTLFALAIKMGWEMRQMDVKGAYLNGTLKEEIYMKQPDGFEDGTDNVCQLVKTLYGLKQAGREWNEEFDRKIKSRGFRRLYADACVYLRNKDGHIEIITVWVDDLILFGDTTTVVGTLETEISKLFETTKLGEPSKIVGIEVTRDREAGTLKISQERYIKELLTKYGLEKANSVSTPMDPSTNLTRTEKTDSGDKSNAYASLVGSLMYLTVATRPDIAYAVGKLASYTGNPELKHWSAAKRVLRYLKGTITTGITYRKQNPVDENTFHGYSDASFASEEDGKSISGYIFMSGGGPIVWGSRKQKMVVLSTTEAEYVALSEAAREAVWLRNLYKELGCAQTKPALIRGDNQGSMDIAENPQFHKRTKHFNVKLHYIREKINEKIIRIQYCPTTEMTADMLTKPLARARHAQHTKSLGMTLA